jgi:hypothetical protein
MHDAARSSTRSCCGCQQPACRQRLAEGPAHTGRPTEERGYAAAAQARTPLQRALVPKLSPRRFQHLLGTQTWTQHCSTLRQESRMCQRRRRLLPHPAPACGMRPAPQAKVGRRTAKSPRHGCVPRYSPSPPPNMHATCSALGSSANALGVRHDPAAASPPLSCPLAAPLPGARASSPARCSTHLHAAHTVVPPARAGGRG